MSKVISAGFVIKSIDPKAKKEVYLLCHASGMGTTQGWGIPKGKVDDKEDHLSAALRETLEETNLDINDWVRKGYQLIIGSTPYYSYTLKDKIVMVYTLFDPKGSLLNYPFACPSEHKPGVPEISEYKWVTLKEAIELATQSQKKLFKFIKTNKFS